MNIYEFWTCVLNQDKDKIRTFFHPDACIRWHNTNECFDVEEFIIANCEYPGSWGGEVKRIMKQENIIVTVTHVYSLEKNLSFHVVSFIELKDEKIASIDEYWGDDGEAPKWRLDKHIGSPIF